jgi:protein subunit release factor A
MITFEDVLRDVQWESFRAAGTSISESNNAVRCVSNLLGVAIDVSRHQMYHRNRETAFELLQKAYEEFKTWND